MINLVQDMLNWTGIGNSSSDEYSFWSGFGSDLGELALVGGIAAMVRHRNCEVRGCWRLGRHTTAAGHKVCAKHNPDGAPTHIDIIKAHIKAKEKL